MIKNKALSSFNCILIIAGIIIAICSCQLEPIYQNEYNIKIEQKKTNIWCAANYITIGDIKEGHHLKQDEKYLRHRNSILSEKLRHELNKKLNLLKQHNNCFKQDNINNSYTIDIHYQFHLEQTDIKSDSFAISNKINLTIQYKIKDQKNSIIKDSELISISSFVVPESSYGYLLTLEENKDNMITYLGESLIYNIIIDVYHLLPLN